MTRRTLVAFLAGGLALAESARTSVRGILQPGGNLLAGGKQVTLTGDTPSSAVINDVRLAGADFEAAGEFAEPGQFKIDPIHKRNMFVWKDAKRLMISYWCSVCSIRTYSPGVCMCCQEDTALDLKEKFTD